MPTHAQNFEGQRCSCNGVEEAMGSVEREVRARIIWWPCTIFMPEYNLILILCFLSLWSFLNLTIQWVWQMSIFNWVLVSHRLMCVYVCMRDTSIYVSSFFPSHHFSLLPPPLSHTHTQSLPLSSLPPPPFLFLPLPPLALHLHFLSLFFPLPIICRCAPDLHSSRYPPEEPAPWFIRVDWSLTFHDERPRFFEECGWRYWYYYSWLVSLFSHWQHLLTHPHTHTHGDFPRPEYSSTALLYLHSVPFDVVSEMYAGILKPSFDLWPKWTRILLYSEFLGKRLTYITHSQYSCTHTHTHTHSNTANRIRNITNNVRIGFGSFNDKPTRPYTYIPVPNAQGRCNVALCNTQFYAFRHQITLTDDITFYNVSIRTIV